MYQITNLSEKQLQIIQDALEMYFRTHIGQLDIVARANNLDIESYVNFKEDLDNLSRKYNLRSAKLQGDYAIASDIHQVIRYKLSWDRYPEGGWTVNFDEPLRWGTEELCRVENSNS